MNASIISLTLAGSSATKRKVLSPAIEPIICGNLEVSTASAAAGADAKAGAAEGDAAAADSNKAGK